MARGNGCNWPPLLGGNKNVYGAIKNTVPYQRRRAKTGLCTLYEEEELSSLKLNPGYATALYLDNGGSRITEPGRLSTSPVGGTLHALMPFSSVWDNFNWSSTDLEAKLGESGWQRPSPFVWKGGCRLFRPLNLHRMISTAYIFYASNLNCVYLPYTIHEYTILHTDRQQARVDIWAATTTTSPFRHHYVCQGRLHV